MVELTDKEIYEKIVTDAYKDICKEKDHISYIQLSEVISKIAYNTEAKAYDIIYDFSVEKLESHEVIKILDYNKFMYCNNKVFKNLAQIELELF